MEKPESDKEFIDRVLATHTLTDAQTDGVFAITAGMTIEVTLVGWEWIAITTALQKVVDERGVLGGSDQMVKDVTHVIDAVTEQIKGIIEDESNDAVIAQRLRDAGYGQ